MKAIIFILLILLNLIITNCEKYDLNDYPLWSNSVNTFKRFIYLKNTYHNTSLEQAGFSYNFTINNTIRDDETFHIYLLKSDMVTHFDLINNPAICCSPEGGVICDDFYETNSNQTTGSKLKYHSIYSKDFNLTQDLVTIEDQKSINDEGIFYSVFLVCLSDNTGKYTDYSKEIYLNGELSFCNSFGYLSAEDFLQVDIYLFLSLFYFLLSIYWVYKLIQKNNPMKSIFKIVSMILPIIILENMINVHIYDGINKSGRLDVSFQTLSVICNVLKNVLVRVLLYLISIGYPYIKYNFKQLSKKKIFNFSLLMIGYLFSFSIYLIIYSKYTFFESSLAYLILALFFMNLTNFYIIWKIYKGVKKQIAYVKKQNITNLNAFYSKIRKLIHVCVIIFILYLLVIFVNKLFPNYYFIWKSQWISDILNESIIAIIIFNLIFMINLNTSEANSFREGYSYHVEENSSII